METGKIKLMDRLFSYQIQEPDQGMDIKSFLLKQGYSTQNLIHLKKTEKSILVNGIWVYVTYILKTGDFLEINLIEKQEVSSSILPVFLPLSIVYEDDDILVINKQSNMPIHPSIHNHDNTLANAVLYYMQSKGDQIVFRCINRLDRDTTGLTIIAKHMLSAGILSKMVSNREIKREYLAIVSGIPKEKNGTINAPIARVADSTIERCVNFESGERAVTHYQVLQTKEQISLLSLHLETGRTHQIRVHLKYIGHPILGDFLYHPDMTNIKRQALHSYRLEFLHPITKQTMIFTAPIPEDMQSLI